MKWPSSSAISSLARYYRSLLRLCARRLDLDVGQKVHAITITTGLYFSPTSFLRNVIFPLYASCGRLVSARKVFDEIPHCHKDTVDWTSLIGSYARAGLSLDALRVFMDMRKNGTASDEVTLVSVFNACSRLGNEKFGIQGQACMIKMGLGSGIMACNAVIDMYVKCGLMTEARQVFSEMNELSVVSWTVLLEGVVKLEDIENGRFLFDKMPERNEVAWTLMIAGYIDNGCSREALLLLGQMVFVLGFVLNYVTLCSLLSACCRSGNVMIGRWVHVYVLKIEHDMDIMVATALLDMYAKCGRINTALQVFRTMSRKNVVAWNALLSGLAMHGRGNDLLDMFHQMIKEVKPDGVTFTAVLSACSHSGLLNQGRHYFYNLESLYGIKPSIEHYACVVDLLGRAEQLEEAEIVIKKMPMLPNEVVLGSLLGSCSLHGQLKLGERLMRELIQMYPLNTEYHVLLSNMYALNGNQEKANSIRKILKQRGIRKIPGMSSIHVGGQVHQFSAGDKSHPKAQEIYLMLDQMIRRLRSAGYVPNPASQVFSPCDGGENAADEQEEKEQALLTHSEKLAVCFGLMTTSSGIPLYIFKNLRICLDCHSAMKIVSAVYDRKIVIRDRNRFHCFEMGSCSCSDYW